MVKYHQKVNFSQISEAPSETIQGVYPRLRYRDFDVTIQFSKGRENDMGFGLRIEIPSIFKEVTITYSMWIKSRVDGSLISLRNRSQNRFDDGRNRGSGAFDMGICRISFSRLQADCLFPTAHGNSIDQEGGDQEEDSKEFFVFWEIHDVRASYDERRILDTLMGSSSPLREIVFESEKEYSLYKYHKDELAKISDQAAMRKLEVDMFSRQVRELRSRLPEMKASTVRSEESRVAKKEKLDVLMKAHQDKLETLQKQNFLYSLLQMDPNQVEIFQFDQVTLELISEGILKIQSELVGRFVSLPLKKSSSDQTSDSQASSQAYSSNRNTKKQRKNNKKGQHRRFDNPKSKDDVLTLW